MPIGGVMMPVILVVDDEPAIVDTVCAILETYGFNAVGATSGFLALEKAAESCPDLLLSDVMMPGMNGFETAIQIKKHCPRCALLFFTGYADMSSLAVDLKSNGYAFEMLSKPVPGAILVAKIRAALAR